MTDAPRSEPTPSATLGGVRAGASDLVGQRIGQYVVKRLIGFGGMGAVYAAEQDRPRRMVALKVMRHDLTHAAALRRFTHESQILGSLKHPGIAQIFEAGTHEHDAPSDDAKGSQIRITPYFAMELIEDAKTLIQYANEKRLDAHARLALFRKVCAAMEYAHQRGVIHRDLKPGNILVDVHGQPKIIDFGVARVSDGNQALASIDVNPSNIVGTLRYMSPEQCDPTSAGSIDTRSDVYSLGVVLFELLTGIPPYHFETASVAEALRIVRETPIRPPSSIEPKLKGDIETILKKTLEKDRDQRYSSVGTLSADIEHFLRHEPILARPPSAIYQFSRFVRRNRALVVSMAIVFVGLTAALAIALHQRSNAIDGRERAAAARKREAEARRAEKRERERATESADSMREALEFLNEMLESASPSVNDGREVTVREVVEGAATRLDSRKFESPRVEAEVRGALGEVYASLDRGFEAERELRRSIELFTQVEGPTGARTLTRRNTLAATLSQLGKNEEAESQARDIAKLAEATFGKDDENVLLAQATLSAILSFGPRAQEGRELSGQVVATYERLGRVDRVAQDAMLNHAFACIVTRDFDSAERLLVKVRDAAAPRSEQRCYALRGLAENWLAQDKLDEAVEFAIQAVEGFEALYARPHSATALAANVVADIYFQQKAFNFAAPFYEKACSILERIDGRSQSFGYALVGRGRCLKRLERDDEARRCLSRGIELVGDAIQPAAKQAALSELIELYEKIGDAQSAQKYRKGS